MTNPILSHPGTSVVFGRSTLSTSFRISLLLHAGLLGLLVLLTAQPPRLAETPLRVRILEEPAPPPAPVPVPQTSAPPPARPREPLPQARPSIPAARGQLPAERFVPRPIPPLDKPAAPVPPTPAAPPTPAPPPPPVAARPTPEVSVPPAVASPPAAPQERLREPPPAPEGRGGLALGGPRQWPATPAPGTGGSSESRPVRPSLRDQIASLGTGLSDEADAKHTISLDDRQPRYLDFLGRLKQRIQREWNYPEEAASLGLVGELLLVFTVNKDGSLLNLRLVHSSGFPVLDNEAMRAVRAAAPFDPTPPEMGSEPWNIRATFAYLGVGRARRR